MMNEASAKESVARAEPGYLRNCWYMAAWLDEIFATPLRRLLLGKAMMFARTVSGAIIALEDRCPHRFAPLSQGQVIGESIECPYHGLQFDARGRCTHNPQGRTPSSAQVATLCVHERHGALWYWAGDPLLADISLIPDFACNDPANRSVGQGYLRLASNYQFATDSILDFSHIDYVHRNSIARVFEKADKETVTMREEGHDIWSCRDFAGVRLGAGGLDVGADPDTLYDRWLDVRWTAPSVMLLSAGLVPAGEDRSTTMRNGTHSHIFTPETATSCHYWFAVSHPAGEQARAALEVEFLRSAFASEDGPMLAAQEEAANGEDFWSLKPIYLPSDEAGTKVRRRLEALIRREREG